MWHGQLQHVLTSCADDAAAPSIQPKIAAQYAALAGNQLQFRYHGFEGKLKHWHYDVFAVEKQEMLPLQELKVQFMSNMSGTFRWSENWS